MSYLLDKKTKRRKYVVIFVFIIIFLLLVYFRSGVFGGLSYGGGTVFRPVLVVGNNIGEKLKSLGSYFTSKNSLRAENEDLRLQLLENGSLLLNYNSVVAENNSLKETLGRKDEKNTMILSAILEKPNQSPYDTLLIDVGTNNGIHGGEVVFALGNIPIGLVIDVFPNSSKVVLFSTRGEKTEVVVGEKNIFMEAVGRGGGNFEMILPRDFTPLKGDTVVLPGINPRVVAVIQTVVSDPRDSFVKALLTSPVNVQELKFVEVEIK